MSIANPVLRPMSSPSFVLTAFSMWTSLWFTMTSTLPYEAQIVFSFSPDINMNGFPIHIKMLASGVHVWPPAPQEYFSPMMLAKTQVPIPRSVTANGNLTLTCAQADGAGGGGQACKIAAVWLVVVPDGATPAFNGARSPLETGFAALKTDDGSCCVPGGSFICDGPCFVNGEILNSSERNVLKLFGPGGVFLNNTIHNTKTTFTENEVFTALPNDCHVYTGATVWRSDVKSGGQVVLEELFFSNDCSSFTKVVKGQQLPGPLICKIRCQRESATEI